MCIVCWGGGGGGGGWWGPDACAVCNFHWSIFESYSSVNMKLKFALLVRIDQKCLFLCLDFTISIF